MKSQNKTPLDLSKESPRYRKKKKSRSPKKSNHKHDYHEVILRIEYKDSIIYYFGKKCELCGNIYIGTLATRDGRMLNEELTQSEYGHLSVIDHRW